MKKYKTMKELGSEMYGGRPNISTHDTLIHKTLTFDIISQTFQKYSLININTSKFFDNTPTSLTSLYKK